ncbi:MAG TPA: hypothetical protein PK185_16170 [Cyclobacteriaceae bacterium]|nr:hypothetical protein [Cyclobacteriaceae bacterium]
MVHILNRHYAGDAKQFDSGKSFHSDPNLRFFEDPEQLKTIIEQIDVNIKTKGCSIEYIPFKLNGIIYAVHNKKKIKSIGRSKVTFYHLQTFYPLVEEVELKKIKTKYVEVITNSTLTGYAKK